MSKKLTRNQLITRYALTGGALGLYFGLFFRPARQPSVLFALILAFLIMLVMTGFKVFRERPSIPELLKAAVINFVKASLFLVLLEIRHPIYDYGGKVAVTIFMTVSGALAGLWYAYDQIRQGGKS